MMRLMPVAALAMVLGSGSTWAVARDDEKPIPAPVPTPTTTPPLKAPDFSGYTLVGDVIGEVVKADDKSVTFRVTWMVSAPSKSRPRLSGNHRNFNNPFSMARHHASLKQEHHDYQLEFVPESLVRFKHLPPKLDGDGKKTSYTQKELDELKQPYSVPGYQASPSDLTPGTYIEVFVIRDKSIHADKAKEDDLRVKYAIILGHDPNPPKDIASPPKTPSKKP